MCTREQCPERRPMEWCNSGGALPTMLPGRVGEKLRPHLGLPEKVNFGPASLNMVLDCARTPIITPELSEPSEA